MEKIILTFNNNLNIIHLRYRSVLYIYAQPSTRCTDALLYPQEKNKIKIT